MFPSQLALFFGLLAVASARVLHEECAALYGQCGGLNWTGPKCCASGSSCVPQQGNQYYSQCLPSSGSSSSPSTSDPPAVTPTPASFSFSTADVRLSQAEEAEILEAFDTWNAALQTGDPETVAQLYTEDAILTPTISNQIRTSRAAIIDYFVTFLAKKPKGQLNEFNIREEGVDKDQRPVVVSNAGIYTFTFGDGSVVGARYTFIYKKVDGKWLIHEHHSSQLPSKFKTLPLDGPAVYKNTSDPALSSSEVEGILEAFDEWNAALATLEPKEVARQYTDDAILLPTVSDDVRTNTAEIEAYFVKFLEKHPQGVINEYHISLESVDEIGEPLEVSNSGIYTFTFGTTGETVTARYTFIYERFRSMNPRSMWLIKQQHSSQLPQA